MPLYSSIKIFFSYITYDNFSFSNTAFTLLIALSGNPALFLYDTNYILRDCG